MCGIFGVITKNTNQEIDSSLFAQLGEANTQRGNLAFGGLVITAGKLNVYRYPYPFDARKVSLDDAQIALGHVRAPTGGQSANLSEIHPFETADFLLAHNGILLNSADFPAWRIYPDLQVDSQVILGGVQELFQAGQPLEMAIQNTIEALDGQQACWLWQKSTQTMYLWRVMAPIYVGATPDATVFSSVKTGFASTLLEEGILYKFNASEARFEPIGQFCFYNPYKPL